METYGIKISICMETRKSFLIYDIIDLLMFHEIALIEGRRFIIHIAKVLIECTHAPRNAPRNPPRNKLLA